MTNKQQSFFRVHLVHLFILPNLLLRHLPCAGKKITFYNFFNLIHNFIQHLKIIQVALQPNNKIFSYAPLCLTSAFNVRNCPTSSIETMKLTGLLYLAAKPTNVN